MDNLHCCNQMREKIFYKCHQHSNIFDCPDNLIYYDEKFDEYGLIIHDGGESYMIINFCPWCGAKFPDSKRGEWFDELEKLGFDDPLSNQTIPEQFKSKDWRI